MPFLKNPSSGTLPYFKTKGTVVAIFISITITLIIFYALTLSSFNKIIDSNSRQNNEYLVQTKINYVNRLLTETGLIENGFYTVAAKKHLANYPLCRDSSLMLLKQLDTLTENNKNIHEQILAITDYAKKRIAIINAQYNLVLQNKEKPAFEIKKQGFSDEYRILIAKIINNIQNYFTQSHIVDNNLEVKEVKTTKNFLLFLIILALVIITFFLFKLYIQTGLNSLLADKNSFLANVVNSTDEAVLMSNINREVIYWNAAAEKLFKRNKADVIGIKFEEAIGSLKTEEEVNDLCNKVFEQGTFKSYSTVKLGDDGVKEIYLSLNLVKNEDGKKVGFSATIMDYALLKNNFQLKNQLEILSENSYNPIIVTDINFKVTNWNNAAVKAYGFNKEEVINQPIEKFIRSETYNKIRFDIRKELIVNKSWQGEIEVIDADNNIRKDLLTINAIKNEKNEVTGYFGIHKNITEQAVLREQLKQLNQTLEKRIQTQTSAILKQNAKLNAIYASSPIYLIELNKEGKIISLNRVRDSNRHPSEFISKDISELIQLETGEDIDNILYEVFTNKIQREASVFTINSKEIRYYKGFYTPVIDKYEVNSVLLALLDVTDLKKAENTLITQKQFYETILNNIPSDIAVFDNEHRYLFVNPKGIKDEEIRKWIIGKRDEDYVKLRNKSEDVIKDRRRVFNETINTKKLASYEEEIIKPDGSKEYIMRYMHPYLNANGEVELVIGYGLNISELKQEKQQVALLNATIENANAYVGICDLEGNYIYLNPAMKAAFEVDDNVDVKTLSVKQFGSNQSKKIIANKNQELFTNKKWSGENVWKSNSGKLLNVYQVATILAIDGIDKYVAVTAIDITHLKNQLDETLRLTEIINRSQAFFAMSDLQGNILFLNNAAKKILELPLNNAPIDNINFEAFRTDEGKAIIEVARKSVIEKGEWAGENYYKTPSGKEIPVLQTMIMHTDSLGNKYISITAVDLTEKKKTENELLKTNAELLELYNRLQSIREDERSEIAKEVHDELGQYLTMLKIDSLWLLEHLNTVDKLFEQRLKNLAANTQYTIDTSRKLMNTLNPGMLQDMGLTATMQWHARTFINSTSIPVLLDIIPAEINFNPKINLCLYRIFQESLTNVLRYANASKVNAVLIYYPDIKEVTLEINDNGVGFDTSKINSLHSHGINGMKERVAALKGIFKITSVPEKGTSVFVKINNADSYQL